MPFAGDEMAEFKTRKKEFLEQIERIVPWGELEGLVKPCYYEGKRGNKPYDLKLMIRIYLLQTLYRLTDAEMRSELLDSRSFSDFCGVEFVKQIPDTNTIRRFRARLIKNGLPELIEQLLSRAYAEHRVLIKPGSTVYPALARIRGKKKS